MSSITELTCRCGVDGFRACRNDEGRVLGGWCTQCNHEWLREEYLHNTDDVVDTLSFSGTYYHKKRYERTPDSFGYEIHKIQPPTLPTPGDHIAWEDGNVHHAIVESVDPTVSKIIVFQIIEDSIKQVEITTKLRSDKMIYHKRPGKEIVLHRASYSDEDLDPTELTLARGRMWIKIGSIPDVFKKNPSSFAVFCKTGLTSVHGKLSSCICGNDARREYTDEDGVVLGFLCKTCYREWIIEGILPNSQCVNVYLVLSGARFLQNKRRGKAVHKGVTQISTVKQAEDVLEKGDHIFWQKLFYDHHAIVEKVNRENHTIEVIHYQSLGKKKRDAKVISQTLRLEEECRKIFYRFTYEDDEKDPPILVNARAHLCLGDSDYNVVFRNCETVAVFCKTGVPISWQIKQCFFYSTLWMALGSNLQMAIDIFFAIAEKMFKSYFGSLEQFRDDIASYIILIVQAISSGKHLLSLYRKYRKGDMTIKDVGNQVVQTLLSGFINHLAMFQMSYKVGTTFHSFFSNVNGLVQAFVGFFVQIYTSAGGGFVGQIIGHIVSTILGRALNWALNYPKGQEQSLETYFISEHFGAETPLRFQAFVRHPFFGFYA